MKDIKVKKKKVTHETYVCPEPGCGFDGETKAEVRNHYSNEHCVEESKTITRHLKTFVRLVSRTRAMDWVEIQFGPDAKAEFVWEGPGWYYAKNWRCYPARQYISDMQEKIERIKRDRKKLAAELGLEGELES